MPPVEDPKLVGLYRGALIGQALSTQLGTAQATGGDISTGIRKAELQAGVAGGQISPASLSTQDSKLLGDALLAGNSNVQLPKPPGGGGVLDALLAPVHIVTNTAGDLAKALEGLPAGIAAIGKAGFQSGKDIVAGVENKPQTGPHQTDLFDIAKGIGTQTVRDFTHFDPMHPLYPLLDLAAIASGGASAAVRTGGALSRLAAGGRLAEEGAQVGRVASTLGRTRTVQALGDLGQGVATKLGGVERPAVSVSPRAQQLAKPGINLPTLPMRTYSVSPFRRLAVEKPIDALFRSRLANTPMPFLSEGSTLSDVRGAYNIRKAQNALRGRASSASINAAGQASQGFNHAMQGLIDSSANHTVAAEKFNALVLLRMLGVENATPEERLNALEQYRDKVLATGTPKDVEGVAFDTPEAKSIREFYRKLTTMPEFMRVFSEPTEAMMKVRDEWDKAILQGLKTLKIDPREILNRSLGPAAHIRDMTPEEVLREQHPDIQASMNFNIKAHDIETALREANGADVPEEALIPQVAGMLPGTAPLAQKQEIVHRAVESLRADLVGEHTPRELLNNAESTGYLPGNNLAQKIAQTLPALGVPEHVAERFATGGLTNYFPQSSALHGMKVRPNGGPISRRLAALPGLRKGTWDPNRVGLHEFKRENLSRLMNAHTLGVEPFSSFLQEADLSSFKGGVDRRDPIVFIRHINQRERLLTHRLMSTRMIRDMTVKDAEGRPMLFNGPVDLANRMGSTVAASKYRLISPRALQGLVNTEDKAALDVANALRNAGDMTPELSEHIDRIVDESAQQYVRDVSGEAAGTKGLVAVPNAYVDNLIKQARVLDSNSRVGHMWQAFINKWRTAVLAYMPSWLLRTSMGHGLLLFISGVWNPKYYTRATSYFGEGFKLPGTEVKLSRQGLKRETPAGIEQGMPHHDFGQIGQHQYMKNVIAPTITTAVHRVANFQRRAAFLSILNRVTKQHFAELGEAFELPGGLMRTENLDKVIAEHPDWVHHALNELDRVSYTFGQMAPWERRLAKNILPFWGWYKFVSKFVWSLPITYPGRALALTRLGEVGNANTDQLGPMPDWLRASIMFDTHDLTKVHYLSMLGLNPLGDVANPAEGIQGLVRLGQMSPIIQAGLEAAGYNTMTGGLENIDPASGIVEVNGKYVDIHTGKEYDSVGQASITGDIERLVGGLARSFPEVRIGEIAMTGGKPVFPESVPFLYERPIPTQNVKDVSPLGILGMYSGTAPKTYNIQKFQLNLLKDLNRARTQQIRSVAKEKLLNP